MRDRAYLITVWESEGTVIYRIVNANNTCVYEGVSMHDALKTLAEKVEYPRQDGYVPPNVRADQVYIAHKNS